MSLPYIQKRTAPLPILFASAIAVGASFRLLASDLAIWLGVGQMAIALLLSWYLLRRSRIAWLVLLISAAWATIAPIGASSGGWVRVTNIILVICLLIPRATSYVWTRQSVDEQQASLPINAWWHRVSESFYAGVAKVAAWESEAERPSRSYGILIWRLGVSIVFLLVGIGVIGTWQEDAGGDSVVIAVLSDIAWTAYFVVQLAFFAAVILAIRGHVLRRGRGPT